MPRTWRSQIADEVRACSMMKPKPSLEIEERAVTLFDEKYKDYYDPGWDEVSEKSRERFRSLAKKQLNI